MQPQPLRRWKQVSTAAVGVTAVAIMGGAASNVALAQSAGNRALGLDVSAWQSNISQTTWNNIRNVENRQFVFVRSSRGGTTGEDHRQGAYPTDDNDKFTLSQRYDDPYFIQNVNRATTAGMFVGSYHFGRHDVEATTLGSDGIPAGVDNSGTDEANHFIQMAGPFMRPGYLPPVFDLEGPITRTDEELTQWTLDFSTRIYEVMQIRPSIYINGNFAANVIAGASASLRNQIAQPNPNAPTPSSPAYPSLWTARWPNQTTPNNIPMHVSDPKDTYSPMYGPWDDYGTTHPWQFWQYASTGRLNSYNSGNSNLDFDVAHGGTEYLKDQLNPALWWSDLSGDWSTLLNWNSGQTPIAPPSMPGQLAPVATGPLPTPRLPGAAGTGPTSGQHDMVILDRPNANITVTLSTGAHAPRKLYVRETLNITGGSLTLGYVPVSESTSFAAQFAANVTITGSAAYTAHTTQVATGGQFSISGGTVTFSNINLNAHSTTPGLIVIGGDATYAPYGGAGTATITPGSGSGVAGTLSLGSGTRTLTVNNGTAAVDLSIGVPISGTARLVKAGAGLLQLASSNSYSGGTTVNAATLRITKDSNLGAAPTSVQANNIILNGGTLQTGSELSTLNLTAPGSGYTSFPTVAVNGAGPDTVTPAINLLASLSSIAVTNGGANFNSTSPATVLITGGGGTGATATATITGSVISAINITNPGSGYTSMPSVYVYNASGIGTGATAAVNGITLTSLELISPGFDYSSPTISITGGGGSGATASVSATSSFAIASSRGIQLGASGGTLHQTAGTTLAYPGVINGSGALNKTGTGTLLLSGINTYTGATTVSAGTFKAGAASTFSPSSAFTINSGTLDLNNTNQAIGSLEGTGPVVLGSGTLIAGGNNSSTTYSGSISGTGGFTKAGTGSYTPTGSNTYTGNTTISGGTLIATSANSLGALTNVVALNSGTLRTANIAAGSGRDVTLTSAGGTIDTNANSPTFGDVSSGIGTLNKIGAGTLNIDSIRAGGASVTGGTMKIAPGLGNASTSVLSTLPSITGGAQLDITDAKMIVQFGTNPSPLAATRTSILNGRNGTDFAAGNWAGVNGITSSIVAASDHVSFAVGYVENAFLPFLGIASYSSFGGQTVDSGSLLIRYTKGADATLDGKVNTDDVTIVGALYNTPGSGQWFLGDFDYDGICDSDDVTVLGAMYDATAPALSSAQLTAQFGSDFAAAFARGRAMGASVPEPATAMGLLGLLACHMRRRRRR